MTTASPLAASVAPSPPWTEAHKREAFIRLCELAIEFRREGRVKLASEIARCANAMWTSSATAFVLTLACDAGFDDARAAAEVAIVRQRAEYDGGVSHWPRRGLETSLSRSKSIYHQYDAAAASFAAAVREHQEHRLRLAALHEACAADERRADREQRQLRIQRAMQAARVSALAEVAGILTVDPAPELTAAGLEPSAGDVVHSDAAERS